MGDLPLWLDEGLAEYFEGPTGRNAEHLNRLPDDEKAGWKPDLVRLETLKSVREMTPRDYRESWAWVHYLLNGPTPGKKALLAYIARPRTEPDAPSFSERLAKAEGVSDKLILTHLDQLRSTPVAAPVASKPTTAEPSIRLQDAMVEVLPPPVPRRGFFDRIFSALGFW